MEHDTTGFEFYASPSFVARMQAEMKEEALRRSGGRLQAVRDQDALRIQQQRNAEELRKDQEAREEHIMFEYKARTTDKWALHAQAHIDIAELLKARGMSYDYEGATYDWHDQEDQPRSGNAWFDTASDGTALAESTTDKDADIQGTPSTTAHARLAQMPARLDALARFRAAYPPGSRIYAPKTDSKREKKIARRIREAVTNPKHALHHAITAELGPIALYWAFNIGDKP